MKNRFHFIEKADKILNLSQQFISKKNKFLNRIKQNIHLPKITNKLNNFYELDFDDFLNELSKQKIKLSLKQQDEWEDYFNSYKKELLHLEKQINDIDKIIIRKKIIRSLLNVFSILSIP